MRRDSAHTFSRNGVRTRWFTDLICLSGSRIAPRSRAASSQSRIPSQRVGLEAKGVKNAQKRAAWPTVEQSHGRGPEGIACKKSFHWFSLEAPERG